MNELILRPFGDMDVALLERWLYMPHIAKWYKHPEHWLNEVRHRQGEFSFITHFIAEVNGTAIGFCQYYDCFFAQEHEVWNDEWFIGDKQGEIFSIDYLVGESQYLRKGCGAEMVRLLTEIIRKIPSAKLIAVEPEQENLASQKVLASNGYQQDKEDGIFKLRLGMQIRELAEIK